VSSQHRLPPLWGNPREKVDMGVELLHWCLPVQGDEQIVLIEGINVVIAIAKSLPACLPWHKIAF